MHGKIHSMTDCTHRNYVLTNSRQNWSKTLSSHKNDFQSVNDSGSRRVEN